MSRRCQRGVREPRFDVERVRADFPILAQQVNGKPLVYLDNAATTQKPRAVIDAIARYYEHEHANVHRGVHTLSQRATDAYEGARAKRAALRQRRATQRRSSSRAARPRRSTWSRRATAAAAQRRRRDPHHRASSTTRTSCPGSSSASRPARRSWSRPIDDDGELDLDALRAPARRRARASSRSRTSRTRSARSTRSRDHRRAHAHGVPVLVDGAQAVPHLPVDVQALDCDFYAFSGHKMYGPTGIGVLYGRAALLEAMPPYQGGGDMIRAVTFDKTTYNDAAAQVRSRHAATSPAPSASAPRSTTCDAHRPRAHRARTSTSCSSYATARARARCPACASSARRATRRPCSSFVLDGIHPHDVGTILDHRRHRDPHRPPLRHAGDGALRRAGHGARLVRLLQHARRTSIGWSPRSHAVRERARHDGPEGALSAR